MFWSDEGSGDEGWVKVFVGVACDQGLLPVEAFDEPDVECL